ncbi:MAG: ABC transporter substrate-binding protein [Paucibacter sp.]|nr:ABC transporter substrate-binding protein [Roseateles sp.]
MIKPASTWRHALAAGCATLLQWVAPAAQADESLLRVRLSSDIRSTDPGTNRDDNTDAVVLHMVEGLVALREDTSVGPMLASRIDVSPDGLRYTFTLREGVHFHNGAPLTAADVVWAWKRYLDPATGWRCLNDFDGRGLTKVLTVEAPDPRTVVFRLERPASLLLATMARTDCGGTGIVHRSSVGPDGKWIAPVGTGPFKFVSWKRGQSIELQRFEGYASLPGPRDGYTGGKKAEVERLRFLVIPDEVTGKTALYSGAIDVFNEARSGDILEIRKNPATTIATAPAMDMFALLIQTRDPLLKDVRIRRALALSLDTGDIAWAVTEGNSVVNNSVLPRSSPYYGATQATGWQRNIALARKLLAEAGYKGQPIKLIANKRHSECFDSAVLIQAMAAEAGIMIELEVLDWATQLDRYAKGRYQAMAFNYSARLDPSFSYEMVSGPKDSQPRKVWDDATVQALLEQSENTTDRARRQLLFDQLHRKMLEDVPLIVLFNSADTVGLRRNVIGFKPWAPAKPRLWNVRIR